MRYHPDKNPNCTVCEEKFSAIAQANTILMDPEKRKVYDKSGSIQKDDLAKSVSIDLTAENFEDLVLRSSDVWMINVYHPDEGFSSQIHPFWESVAQDEQKYARFGRLDAFKHKDALKFLPMRPRMYPTVMRLARGMVPEIFPIYEADANGLPRFFLTYYPRSFPSVGDSELKRWIAKDSETSKVVLLGQEPKGKKSLMRRKLAYQWQDVMTFRHTSREGYLRVAGSDALKETGDRLLLFPAKGANINKPVLNLVVPKKEEEFVKVLMEFANPMAPLLTTRNYEVLCRSTSDIRNYCLALVDAEETESATNTTSYQLPRVMKQLAGSMTAYKEELKEIEAAGSELSEAEEQFNIQVVRLSSRASWSLLPQPTVGHNAHFQQLHASQGYPQALLFDVDTKRVAPWTKPSVTEIYQSIAYGDLTLKEFDEGFLFSRTLPDLEETMGQHARRVFFGASWLQRGLGLLAGATMVEIWANVMIAGSMKGLIAASLGTVVTAVLSSPPLAAGLLPYIPGFLLPA
jgi:curved DNA-binding protein CbpA